MFYAESEIVTSNFLVNKGMHVCNRDSFEVMLRTEWDEDLESIRNKKKERKEAKGASL